ncbi:hypothetical protein CW749_07725 [Vibrio sp. vnigr-6D03]|uniref:glycosyltransferase family 2 protein n=1 Tax=Vibrio sp. vnigr-6D03 TaxID=2058088 RepID=UPI000C342843|nr:glycosyltransferase [Vibrio sp. vnigr-6D03]PKF80195.1 hypothetical protein CW749_07725 [Vibrio sp. vnigr-6D03]
MTNKKELKVSVLVPAYNAADTIEQCIASIAEISSIDLDLIVTDDGSKDATASQLLKLQQRYNFRLVTQENSGQAASRNRMMTMAEGDYILFCDADDYVDAKKIEEMVKYAHTHHLDLCMGTNFEVDPRTKQVYVVEKEKRLKAISGLPVSSGLEYLPKAREYKVYSATTPSHLWSRQFIEQYHLAYLEGVRYEDVDFTFKSLLHADRVSFLDSQHYFYVQHENSSMRAEGGTLRPADIRSHAAVVSNLMEEISSLKSSNSSTLSAFFKLVFMDYMQTVLRSTDYALGDDRNVQKFQSLVKESGLTLGERVRIWRKFGLKVYAALT